MIFSEFQSPNGEFGDWDIITLKPDHINVPLSKQ